MHDDAATRLAASGGEIADRLDRTGERIDELRRRLAEERMTWQSEDELYAVEVDGNGQLLDLHIAPRALGGAHLERIGANVVAAIDAARSVAVAVSRQRWGQEFGTTTMLDGLLPEVNESDTRGPPNPRKR